jgi:hypothetical protein
LDLSLLSHVCPDSGRVTQQIMNDTAQKSSNLQGVNHLWSMMIIR